MPVTTYAGIDYGLGQANVDTETGIRYGVISSHSVGEALYESQEMDYAGPFCPKCGNDATEIPSHTESDPSGEGKWVSVIQDIPAAYEEYETARHECADYACEHCQYLFGSESAFSEEASGWHVSGDGYELRDCLDSDVFILKAPYFTYAQFCSPCVPGACSLDSPMDADTGAKCYCLGHDWFESGTAPYAVYSVATGEEVQP